jgi:hypothetical protein
LWSPEAAMTRSATDRLTLVQFMRCDDASC